MPFTALAVVLVAVAVPIASADPPPGRAYELVSPVDDPSGAVGGLSTDLLPMPGIASDDGDRVLYGAGSSLGPSWSGPSNPMIFGRRTATGWTARTAMRSLDHGNTPLELSSAEAVSGRLTPDGTNFVFGAPWNFGAAPVPVDSYLPGIYRSPDADLAPEWLSQPVGVPVTPGRGALAISTTSDVAGETVAFSSVARLTADAPPQGTSAVYAWRNGQVELVSRLPDGTVPSEDSFMANASNPGAGALNPPAVTHRNQLAGGGRFVLFRVGGTYALSALYVRDLENQVTFRLSGGAPGAPEMATTLSTSWGGAGQNLNVDNITVPVDAMVFAARDAARAYFKVLRSGTGGTGTATPAFIYEANLATGALSVPAGITGAPLGLSPDGERMLFIEPPASGSAVGDWTLRYWDRATPGSSVAVGTIASTAANPTFGLARVYRVSDDGRTWIFTASGSPDPARLNVAPATQQLYRWTVGDTTPTCLSCEPTDGVVRTSGVSLTVQENIATEQFVEPTTAGLPGHSAFGNHKKKLAQPGHSVSDDGRWILFDSPDRLVDEDDNDVRDVYLWDREGAPGGELQLVTSGEGNTPSYALDLDPTGRNAFFSTREGLVPADKNGNYDVYVARIGGGFPDSPESCVGEACRPAVIPAPPLPQVGSITFGGDGNVPLVPDSARVSVGVSKLRPVSGSAASLRVRVPDAGRIVVRGPWVRGVARSARRAGVYRLRVALRPRAKKLLRKRNRVRINARVSFKAKSGPSASKTISVTFKQPKAKRAKAKKGGR